MILRSLDEKTVWKGLTDAPETDLEEVVLPEGVTRKQFDIFVRVMEAKESTELKDIPVEDLAALFANAEGMISVFYDDSVLSKPDKLFDDLMRADSVRVVKRIL